MLGIAYGDLECCVPNGAHPQAQRPSLIQQKNGDVKLQDLAFTPTVARRLN